MTIGLGKGLRSAGYATDPRYPQKLIHISEVHLWQFDSGFGDNHTLLKSKSND
jgi:flagellum-specific peptidoglycan hydrolase FlgJ